MKYKHATYLANLELDPLLEQYRNGSVLVFKYARLTLGLSQSKAAKMIGTSQPCLGKIEAGLQRLDVAQYLILCRAASLDPNLVFENHELLKAKIKELVEKLGPRKRMKKAYRTMALQKAVLNLQVDIDAAARP